MGGGPRLPLPGVQGPQVEAGGTGPGPLSPGRCLPRGGQTVSRSAPRRGDPGPPPLLATAWRGDPAPKPPCSLDLGVPRSLLRAPLECCKTQPQHSNRTVPERDPNASHPKATPQAPCTPEPGPQQRRTPAEASGGDTRGWRVQPLCNRLGAPAPQICLGEGGGGVSRCLLGHGGNR